MNPSEIMVSIITPVYNSALYIEKTIRSVQAQTYVSWEHIIIDDGSIDGSAEIIKKYQDKDSRIKYIYQQNQGQSAARNVGIQQAKGSLVAFLDSDDLWLPEKLEISVSEFSKGDQDLLYTGTFLFRDDAELICLKGLSLVNVGNKIYQGGDGLSEFLYKNRIPTLTVVVKKDAVLQVGGFYGSMSEDYQLWIKLLLHGFKLRSIQTPLSMYRMHSDSLSSKDRYISKSVLLMLNELQKEYSIDWQQQYNFQIKNWIIRYIRKAFKKDDKVFLKEMLLCLGFYKKSVGAVLYCASVLPLSVTKRLIRILIS